MLEVCDMDQLRKQLWALHGQMSDVDWAVRCELLSYILAESRQLARLAESMAEMAQSLIDKERRS